MALLIKNPHSILATLVHRPDEVLELELPREKNLTGAWKEVETLWGRRGPKRSPSGSVVKGRDKGGRNASKSNPSTGGFTERGASAYAVIQEKRPIAMETLLRSRGPREKSFWIGLDCVQDPQNVGAIFRTAAFMGATGVLMTSDRSAPLTSVVYDIAAGGVESLPFSQVTNLVHALEFAKEEQIWILGTSEHSEQLLSSVSLDRDWLVMVGNEEKGLRRLTQENCDLVVKIPPISQSVGSVTSLNVSVATGMVIYRLVGNL